MNSTALCHALLSGNHHVIVDRNRHRLEWAANRLNLVSNPGEPCGKLLGWIIEYDKANGYCPSSKAVQNFVELLKSEGKDSVNAEDCVSQLSSVKQYAEDQGDSLPTDVPSLIEASVDTARRLFHAYLLDIARGKALGETSVKENKTERVATPVDAINYLREAWATKDLHSNGNGSGGKLHECTEGLKASFDKILDPRKSDRVLTWWTHVDSKLVIGPQDNSYIGIAAYPNQCKSTVAMTLAFNFWQQGLNGIFVSLEHTPEENRQKFALLVNGKYGPQFSIPPLQQWKLCPETITQQNRDHLNKVIDDIAKKEYTVAGVKGKHGTIDFQEFRTWDDIVSYAEAENLREPVHFLIVDYIPDLDTPGTSAKITRDDSINEIFRQGQVLSRTFDNNRGLIVVSPLQIKKAAYDAARKVKIEGGVLPRRYYLDAISMYSAAIQRMDVIMALFMDDPVSYPNDVEMHFIKVRNGEYPVSRMMNVNKSTREVYDKTDTVDREITFDRKGLYEEVIGGLDAEMLNCLDIDERIE